MAKSAHKPKTQLPSDELQALADVALAAWESGVGKDRSDSVGGVWRFLPVRDPYAGLEITLIPAPEEPPRRTLVSQRELGTEQVRTSLASIILALSEPVQAGGPA